MDVEDTKTDVTTEVAKVETESAAKVETTTEVDAAKEPKTDETTAATKKKAADGEEVELDKDERVSISYSSFQQRLRRAGRSALRDIFGSDDADKIKKDWANAQKAVEKLNATEKASLTETERYKKEAEERAAEVKALRDAMQEKETNDLASKGEAIVVDTAGKYIAKDYIEDAVTLYQMHLSNMSKRELEDLDSDAVESWFKDYAKKRPALAAKAETKTDAKTETKTTQRPLDSGAKPTKPLDGKGASTGKTPRPGKANSMTREEWEQYKRENDLNF